MRKRILTLLLVVLGIGQCFAQTQEAPAVPKDAAQSQTPAQEQQPPTLQDPSQLAGKRVTVGRLPLCKPKTYTPDTAHYGMQATVVSVKPAKAPALSKAILDRTNPEMRAMMVDQQKAALVLFQFDDGTTLDTCLALGPKTLSDNLELVPGQTLDPLPEAAVAAPGKAKVTTPQECPVMVTEVTSRAFAHAFADRMMSSEYERQTDKAMHGGQGKHYIDMRVRNNAQKSVKAVEVIVVYANKMGDETGRTSQLFQNDKPIKPGKEEKGYSMDREEFSQNGEGEVTVYISRVRFEDDSLWQDNGSQSCALTKQIKRSDWQ